MGWYDDYLRKNIICPVCGKKFVPAPEHYWKIGNSGYETRKTNVCSYSCMRKWEKELEAKKDYRRERAKRAKEKRTY